MESLFNVISIGCNNTNVASCKHLFYPYLQMCVWYSECYYMCCIMFIYTVDLVRLWSPLIIAIVLIGHSHSACSRYIMYSPKLLWLYYHYILFLLMSPPCFLPAVIGACLNTMPVCVLRTFLFLAVF